ncbi:AsmA family protein [Desulfovibrio sp. Fe33]|uniref:AsmA family protein n=1 Tax=Desulfovibrio sp. Fe33 TaxID=3020842 RepID=UPI00234D4C1D|nr:AsmA family protein [Desulfovibrio sp. Fe33]
MLRKLPHILVECLVALVLVCTGLLLWVSYYIDTGEFRDRLKVAVEEALDRPVRFGGDIDLAFWPRLAVTLEDVSVGEAVGFGDGPAARFDDISVSVRIVPLFSHRIEVESLELDGLEANIIRNGDGIFNWQSLTGREDSSDSGEAVTDEWTFSVHSVKITDAAILFRDELEKTEYRLSGIDINTGTVQFGVDVPFSLNSDFAWDDQGIKAALELKGMVRANSDGSLPVFSRVGVQARVFGDFLPKGDEPGEFIADVDLNLAKRIVEFDNVKASLFGLRAEGNMTSGDLSEGLDFKGHVTVRPFVPRTLIARYAPKLPLKDVDGLNSGAVASFVHVTEEGMSFDNLVVALDDISVRGQCGFKGWQKPVFDFALRGNSIDLDRYLPLFRTGTPFIWDDFALPFFGAFRGNGTVRADGFKVLDISIADVRLKAAATDKGIDVDAGAIRDGFASLGGKLNVVIGQETKGIPTLSLSCVVDADSRGDGFAFLQQDFFKAGGAGKLHLEVLAPKMTCRPDARSINFLQHLDGVAKLSLGQGKAVVTREEGDPLDFDYSQSDLELKVASRASKDVNIWNGTVSATARVRSPGSLKSLNVTAQGPVTANIDPFQAKSSGVAVNGYLTATLLPNEARRLGFDGTVAFDSEKGTARLRDGVFQALETTLKGEARLAGTGKERRAEGSLSIDGADPKRIIYLLTGKSLSTRDGEALRKASVRTEFSADGRGFTLSDLQGELDGMEIKGHVVGTGYVHPMFAFSLAAGSFDLDRYLTKSPAPSLEDVRRGVAPKAKPVELPLEFLRSLKLNGKVFFREFTLARIRWSSLEGFVRANAGIISLARMQGKLHDGDFQGNMDGEVGEDSLALHLLLDVEGMQAGPFMAEMAQREYVRGKTYIKGDLRSVGRTDDDILANLEGKASVVIDNGSFKFTGWDAEPVQPTASRSSQIGQSQVARSGGRTSFRRVDSEATVKEGVFHIDKFRLEAPPVLQAYGEGSFSLPANTIAVSIRNDFVAVPSVTLRLTGKLTDPKVDVPTGRIVNDTVLNILSLPKKSFEFLRDLF